MLRLLDQALCLMIRQALAKISHDKKHSASPPSFATASFRDSKCG